MDAYTLLALLVAFVAGNFILGEGLSLLNLLHPRPGVPEGLAAFIDAERYAKSRAYHAERARLGIIRAAFACAATLAMLCLGGFAWLDGLAAGLAPGLIPRTLVFFGILLLANEVLGLPWSIYATFGIEARYGFNRTTPATFAADRLKSWLLGGLIGGLLLSLFLLLLSVLGSGFWIWFSLVALAFMLAMNLFYTSLILPLFNKLCPLPEGELREAIREYAAKAGFPLGRILVMDGSKRTSKANAFFSGLGRQKNIVLFDTLIDKHPVDEVVAVLAHEIGHWRHRHARSGLILGAAQLVLSLFLLSLVVDSTELSRALGWGQSSASGWGQSSVALNLLAFGLLFSPLSALSGLGMLVLSRRHEFQADAWAARGGYGEALATALKRLSADSLSDLHPHPWLVFWEYSHPPLLARLAALEAAAKVPGSPGS